MQGSGFSFQLALPDLWQQEAVRAVRGGSDVIVDAPTGAGKTRIFELLVEGGWKGQAVYTVPTRALANDKRLEWQRKGWPVGIVTGDICEHPDAPVVVATLETQRERLLRGDGPRLLVIDEYQMLGDPVRGTWYELAIALAPSDTRLLLLSGSVGNAKDVAEWMRRLGRRVELVTMSTRPVPLEEMPVEQLPRRAPKKVTGFWPRLAAEVLLSGLGPLLIFAPQRRDAEKIARQIAAAVPTPDVLGLTREQEQVLGSDYAPLLRQRVACHHSGMSYQQRAGIIEPLAKAGQLRVVVATTGLAAGINFSMRSVMVADTVFFDGRRERQIAPDELLQMFGRAGRRGLDEVGYVISAVRSPRLGDASQRYLRRSNQIDWPTLMRVMDRAATRGEAPFAAAARFCEALFSRQRIVLGFEERPTAPESPPRPQAETVRADQNTLFGLRPTRAEVMNSRGEWEVKRRERWTTQPLRKAWVHYRNHIEPALEAWHFVVSAFPIGRVCRMPGHERSVYGKEIAVALERGPKRYVLTKNVRQLTGLTDRVEYTLESLEQTVLPQLVPHLHGGQLAGLVQRQEILALQIDFSDTLWTVYEDAYGVALVEPDERLTAVEQSSDVVGAAGSRTAAARDSAAWAWRRLGLVAEDGTPTQRGVIFSLFSAGEGLAIAAALEDESYPLDELALHLANIRGGHRFSECAAVGGSERLAAACLQTYGAANHDGYLDAGLPPGYGEGTAEAIADWLAGRGLPEGGEAGAPGDGDLERAFTEWVSLLRQVVGAPDVPWERWARFQAVCREELAERERLLPSRELPALPAIQLNHATRHQLVAL